MAETYPIDILPQLPGWTTSFKLKWRQEQSRQAGGRTLVKDLGSPLWTLAVQSKSMPVNQLDYWRARLDMLENGLQLFKAYSMSRCFPQGDPGGKILATAVGDPPEISIVGVDNKSIVISGLVPNYPLNIGDMLAIQLVGRTSLHRIMNSVIVSGAGLSTSIEVRPHLPPGIAVGQEVILEKPGCVMTMVPDSLNDDAEINGWGSISFQAMESRG